jgi:hypothetical protein
VHYFLMQLVRFDGPPDGDEIEEVRLVAAERALALLRSRRDRQALVAARPARRLTARGG